MKKSEQGANMSLAKRFYEEIINRANLTSLTKSSTRELSGMTRSFQTLRCEGSKHSEAS